MEELTFERQEQTIIHTVTLHISYSQRDEWIVMPTNQAQDVLSEYSQQNNSTLYLLQEQFLVHKGHLPYWTQHGIKVHPMRYTPVLQFVDKGIQKPFNQGL